MDSTDVIQETLVNRVHHCLSAAPFTNCGFCQYVAGTKERSICTVSDENVKTVSCYASMYLIFFIFFFFFLTLLFSSF